MEMAGGRYRERSHEMSYDFTQLYGHYPEAIAEMPVTFTSHKFILRLAQENQTLYIEALYEYRNRLRAGVPAPFMLVHGVLANHLHEYPGLITKVSSAVSSHDIFGGDNTASQWRRVGAADENG
jgi:hypothetical protein